MMFLLKFSMVIITALLINVPLETYGMDDRSLYYVDLPTVKGYSSRTDINKKAKERVGVLPIIPVGSVNKEFEQKSVANKLLFQAVIRNDRNQVVKCIDDGADLNVLIEVDYRTTNEEQSEYQKSFAPLFSPRTQTLSILAASLRDNKVTAETLELLVRRGASVFSVETQLPNGDVLGPLGSTFYWKGADLATAKLLITNGVNPENDSNNSFEKPSRAAYDHCKKDFLAVAELLISNGVDLSEQRLSYEVKNRQNSFKEREIWANINDAHGKSLTGLRKKYLEKNKENSRGAKDNFIYFGEPINFFH